MYTIWKYNLKGMTNDLEIPAGGKVLSAGQQHDIMFIWVLVNPKASTTTRHFRIISTGEEFVPQGQLKFIDRVTVKAFEFHVFEDEEMAFGKTAQAYQEAITDI